MALEKKEIEANFQAFTKGWKDNNSRVRVELEANRAVFLESYTRLVSLNSWREDLLAHTSSGGSLEFFLEAQNDALISHVFAAMGSWRAALKSLRSCVENVASCLFYKDHPVELLLWCKGKHRVGFSELLEYFSKHPKISADGDPLSSLKMIRSEYSTLSRAVHGSAAFRMTGGLASTSLWISSARHLGAWQTRERNTICGLNLLLLTLYGKELQGTRNHGLRLAVGFAVPASKYPQIKRRLGVSIPTL